ncbi:MAG: VWA domain-containing protein, partial [Vicinamibacterales bacterium]
MLVRGAGWAGALLLSATALLIARQPQSADRSVFRAGVDIVRLDIQVTDESGKPISDLRPDEVQVIDAGTRQPVVLFQHIVAAGRTKFEAEQRTVAGEISTNQGAPRGQLYVLVFDQDHITSGAEQTVREAADTFLRRRFRPGEDRVAVFGLPGPGPSLSFTADVTKAIAQLALVRGGMQRTLTPGDRDMTVNEAYEILRGDQNVVERFMTNQAGASNRTGVLPDITGKAGGDDANTLRKLITDQANLTVQNADAISRRFLDMMSQMLRTFRDLDGRKTVILFSEGFHEDNISPTIKQVAAAAAETYSVIYAFDLNRRADTLTSVVPVGGDIASEISNRLDSMSSLANDTNGQLIRDASTHLDEALAALGAAEVDYYVIGFPAPDAALADRNDYRHVTVKVDRPGVRVHTRTGYVAGPAPTAADRRRSVETALTAPFAQQGLRVEYTTYVGQSEHPGLQAVAVSLAAQLPLAPAGRDASADVVFVVMDRRTGQIVAKGSDAIGLPHDIASGFTTG